MVGGLRIEDICNIIEVVKEILKNQEIRSHLVATLVYCLILLPLVVLKWRFDLFFFLIGAGMGTFILDLDHLIYAFLYKPHEPSSHKIRVLFMQRDWQGLVRVLQECHQEHTELFFHQAIFQVIFLFFAFFIITSTPSFLAKGIVMAANLHLLKDEWADQIKSPPHLNQYLFWQVGREIDLRLQKFYLVGVSVVFLFLNLILI